MQFKCPQCTSACPERVCSNYKSKHKSASAPGVATCRERHGKNLRDSQPGRPRELQHSRTLDGDRTFAVTLTSLAQKLKLLRDSSCQMKKITRTKRTGRQRENRTENTHKDDTRQTTHKRAQRENRIARLMSTNAMLSQTQLNNKVRHTKAANSQAGKIKQLRRAGRPESENIRQTTI